MFRFAASLIFLSANCCCLIAQTDSSEIKTWRYRGYIMPLDTYQHSISAEFRPSRNEIKLAEKLVRKNLFSYCRHLHYLQFREPWVIATSFRRYYRQYRGIYEDSTCHKYMNVVFIRPGICETKEELRRKQNIPFDDGYEFFYAWVDLDEKRITGFMDCGWVN